MKTLLTILVLIAIVAGAIYYYNYVGVTADPASVTEEQLPEPPALPQ